MKVTVGKNMCRSCLGKNPENSIFQNIKLAEQFQYVTGKQVLQNDGLPDGICKSCAFRLNISYDFKKQCEHSIQYMEQLLMTINRSFESVKTQIIKTHQITNDDVKLLKQTGYYSESSTPEQQKTKPMNYNNKNTESFERFTSDDHFMELWNETTTKEDPLNTEEIDFLEETEVSSEINLNSTTNSADAKYKTSKNTQISKDKQNDITSDYYCPICEKYFSSRSNLNRHLIGHKRMFKCDICGREFSQKCNLRDHIMCKHISNPLFNCDECNEGFKTKRRYRRHMRYKHSLDKFFDKSYPCDRCDKLFRNTYDLKIHRDGMHSTSNEIFECNLCLQTFKWKQSLAKHLKKHEMGILGWSHPCKECGTSFETEAGLRRHSVIHSVHKPYKCDYCDRDFTRKSSRDQHQLQHNKTDVNEMNKNKNKGIHQLKYLVLKPLKLDK